MSGDLFDPLPPLPNESENPLDIPWTEEGGIWEYIFRWGYDWNRAPMEQELRALIARVKAQAQP